MRTYLSPTRGLERRGGRRRWRDLTAPQLFLLSFVLLIAVGTAGLLWLPGLYTGAPLGLIDALFTATSAVCVTGLIVVDTATYFTTAGQAWIALLIQAGGLGMITFTTLILTSLGRRGPVGLDEVWSEGRTILRDVDPAALVRTVVLFTFAVEAVGALLFWIAWSPEFGAVGAVWPAVFHAVSAFCNAGFSTFSDSLVGFDGSSVTLLIASVLIVTGGLGFVVVEDLRERWRAPGALRRRLSLHTTLVLTSTAVLLLGGWVLFSVFEWNGVLAHLPALDRATNALFMSVTPRTAGFNTVDYAQVSNPSLFLTIVLMVVGGSPGSTAGGLKTVTVALLLLTFVSRLRGDERVSTFDRTLPQPVVQRAVGIALGGIMVLGLCVFLLLVLETGGSGVEAQDDFLPLVFEVHSAFGTVGLSMGATDDLSPAGRLLISVLMFLGRVGPPTAVAAMAAALRRHRRRYRYGEEEVLLG